MDGEQFGRHVSSAVIAPAVVTYDSAPTLAPYAVATDRAFPMSDREHQRAAAAGSDDQMTRALDVAFSVAALIVLAPVLLLISTLIALEGGGPVLFKQQRYGRGGRPFTMFKFRTMKVMEDGRAELRQATRNDPRITAVGAILRRTSLDELPQLLNILRGDMSLVGPRPHPMALDHQFAARAPFYAARFRVRPGLTGLAQVRGYRGEIHEDEDLKGRIRNDLAYVRRRSLGLYLLILAQTALVVFFQKEAY